MEKAHGIRAIIELGRERRVALAFETGEALSVCLLVAAVEPPASSTPVPARLNISVESSSVAHYDALLGGAL